jgi:2-polyprenyl-3-methyl-5-hydroxy-6-metoxy-1,4-benzoquinol methylase
VSHERSCPICLRCEYSPVGPRPEAGDPQGVVCHGCGLVFAQPMHTPQDKAVRSGCLRALHRSRSSEQTLEEAFHKSRARAERCRDLLTAALRPGDRVLEVGSGDGAILSLLKDLGTRPTGLDPDAEAAAFASRKLRVDVLAGEFETADFSGRRFDAVVMIHLIEHLYEPVEALVRARRLLRPGGTLFLETPNILRPKVGPRRVFSYAHNYHFSPRTMARALHQAGFTTLTVRIFNRDSFQVVARATPPAGSPPGTEPWQQVARTIALHPWKYAATLQFLWRKLPGIRDWMIYGRRQELAGESLTAWLREYRSPPADHAARTAA